MLSEKARGTLFDIRDNSLFALSWSADFSAVEFQENRLVFYAVTRCLEIISEASRRLPEEILIRHPNIEWRDIRDAGNVYRHDYDGVQETIVFTHGA